MKMRLLFILVILGFTINLNAQCWVPDYTYCYDDGITNVVAFEVCDASTVSAEIFQGEFDPGFDDLKVNVPPVPDPETPS